MVEIVLFTVFILSSSIYAKKKNFLPNFSGQVHQEFLDQKKIPLVGGMYLLLLICMVYNEIDIPFLILCILIYIVGFFSDSNSLSSPKIRFLVQFLLILIFVFSENLIIKPIRIDFVDHLFEKTYFGIFFTTFCLLILINGSNFIDGLNGLVLGYMILIVLVLKYNNLLYLSEIIDQKEIILIFCLFCLLTLNFFNFFYLGDGGSYLAGSFLGFLLITIYNSSSEISPYYIILLIWYPCFEILFSLLRKIKNKKSPIKPDNLHLHQLLYFFILTKTESNKKLVINNISSLIINSFNFLIFILGSLNKNLSVYQITLVIFAVFFYFVTYLYLINYKKLKLIKKKLNHTN